MAVRSAREVAYETIRSRIITMELKPGDELNDRELAQELGISRTPMREALIMLNIAHMVTIKPQSGTHVAPIDLTPALCVPSFAASAEFPQAPRDTIMAAATATDIALFNFFIVVPPFIFYIVR